MNTEIELNGWNIATEEFPHTGTSSEKLQFLLRYAVLAPSSHNTQPWLFRIRGNEVELYADRTRAARVADPDDRELIISCGAALCHLRIAMQHFAYLGSIEIFPDAGDPDLLARVRLGFKGDVLSDDHLLFNAILHRRTNRHAYTDDPVSPSLLADLETESQKEDVWFYPLQSLEARCALGDLIAEADRIQWANKRFRLELAAWLRPIRSASQDGIPGYAYGVSDLLSCAAPLAVRTFDLGEGQAAKDRDIAAFSPVIAVLGTVGDTPRDWIASGQALARVLLRARAGDVWASFLNQPLELPEMRQRVPHVIGRPGFPQLILRFGFGLDVKPTPRRSVEDVLVP